MEKYILVFWWKYKPKWMKQSLWMTSTGNLTGAPLNGGPSIREGSIIWDLDRALTQPLRAPKHQIDTFIDVVTDRDRSRSNIVWSQIWNVKDLWTGLRRVQAAPPIAYYRPQQHRWAALWGSTCQPQIYTYVYTNTNTHMYTQKKYTNVYTNTNTHVHTYILKYIHTNMHTEIHYTYRYVLLSMKERIFLIDWFWRIFLCKVMVW